MTRPTVILCEAAGLILVTIIVTHDLTPQRIEQHHEVPVESAAMAMQKCSATQELESRFTQAHPQERGRTSVRCLLKHPDGTVSQLVSPLEVAP